MERTPYQDILTISLGLSSLELNEDCPVSDFLEAMGCSHEWELDMLIEQVLTGVQEMVRVETSCERGYGAQLPKAIEESQDKKHGEEVCAVQPCQGAGGYLKFYGEGVLGERSEPTERGRKVGNLESERSKLFKIGKLEKCLEKSQEKLLFGGLDCANFRKAVSTEPRH